MAEQRRDDDTATGCGCLLGGLALLVAIALLISLAALVDPFGRLPTVGAVWSCEDEAGCELAERYPGFWGQTALSLLWTAAAGGLLLWLAGLAADLRERRRDRFLSPAAARACREGRRAADGVALLVAGVAVLPLLLGPRIAPAVVVVGLAVLARGAARWPYAPTEEEERHRELDAAWRSVRPDADADVPWARFAAWAEPRGEEVELVLLLAHPTGPRVDGAPSPFDRRVVRRLAPDAVEDAAAAMEALREEAAEREARARRAWHDRAAELERRRHAGALAAVDAADALARALRRP
jgi:hypothetical protein